MTQIGRMDFAAVQDWMCEPEIVVKTGLSIAEHQRRTVANLCALRELGQLSFSRIYRGFPGFLTRRSGFPAGFGGRHS